MRMRVEVADDDVDFEDVNVANIDKVRMFKHV